MKKLVLLALLSIFASSACADITTGLVGWWKLDEASGNIAYDSSGYGNDGTIGSSDQWCTGGGWLNFDGGSYGASGIVFANNGADLVADMALTSQVTVSYWATWEGPVSSTNYPYDGRDAANVRLLSSEQPTGQHIRDHKGGDAMWCWGAFDETSENFIYQKNGLGKTWGDWIMITTTVNFDTGDHKIYVDGQVYASATGKTGSFADLATFTIGRTLWAEMEGYMTDFRIYNRELSALDIRYNEPFPTIPPIPEPATLALLGLGGLTFLKRKRN